MTWYTDSYVPENQDSYRVAFKKTVLRVLLFLAPKVRCVRPAHGTRAGRKRRVQGGHRPALLIPCLCPYHILYQLECNIVLGGAPDFEADLVARVARRTWRTNTSGLTSAEPKVEQNRRRSRATSRNLRSGSGKSRPKAGCEYKGFIYGQTLSPFKLALLR